MMMRFSEGVFTPLRWEDGPYDSDVAHGRYESSHLNKVIELNREDREDKMPSQNDWRPAGIQ
jgi:hypothetical protein